jgi:nitronate monooxygenase
MPFVAEIKKFFHKTILLSGCISNGQDIASALQMGADVAYMGTRFINTKESKAPEDYRKMIIESDANDIVYTAAISGVSANFLRASLEAMGITEEMLKRTKKIDFGKELSAMEKEAKAWSTIWSAGQGVTNISDNPTVKDLVDLMKKEFKVSIEAQQALLEKYN